MSSSLSAFLFREIPGNSGKFREIPGNSGKMSSSLSAFFDFSPEIPGNSGKFREIPGNSGKLREIPGRCHQVCLPFFVFFPQTSQKISPKEFLQKNSVKKNLPVRNAPGTISKGDQADGKWHRKRKENDQDTEKFREIPGRCHQVCLLFCSGKFREIPGNSGKFREIPGRCHQVCLPFCFFPLPLYFLSFFF